MYDLTDTIYALSSGHGMGGVAVIRVSGSAVLSVVEKLTGLHNPRARYAYYATIKNGNQVLDHALVLYFKAPHSFTGEDVVEFHVHGGRAVIDSVFKALSECAHCRPAEHGEFSRRAVINGKMDLTAAEGMMDLIEATTDRQQAQALTQMDGALDRLYEEWRAHLTHDMAYLEAFIDFPEEEIPPEKMGIIDTGIRALIEKIKKHLNDNNRGQKLRDGFQIAIIGTPNAGKSSLMNELTNRQTAIVSQTAGTTRDVVEAYLNIDGFPVILADTAGLRETEESIEAEGIRRAVKKAEEADLVIYLIDPTNAVSFTLPDSIRPEKLLTVYSKADLKKVDGALSISTKTRAGLEALHQKIKTILSEQMGKSGTGVITRERYRVALQDCVRSLNQAVQQTELELKAEDLRMAARALARITGRIETDDLLDVIFRDFCIGK